MNVESRLAGFWRLRAVPIIVPRPSQRREDADMLVMKGASTTYSAGDVAALRGAMMPAAPMYPWSDTGRVDVEVLVTWTFRDQRAESTPTRGLFEAEALAAGLTWFGASRDGCAAIDRIGALNCRIDVSGPGRDALHPVAEAVAAAVAQAGHGDAVRHFGRLGERPDWQRPTRCIVPEAWVVEGVEAMWCYAERRSGAHCPVFAVWDATLEAGKRAAYVRWWDALEALAWMLSGRALGFVVDAPAAVREPWKTECA